MHQVTADSELDGRLSDAGVQVIPILFLDPSLGTKRAFRLSFLCPSFGIKGIIRSSFGGASKKETNTAHIAIWSICFCLAAAALTATLQLLKTG